MRPVITDSSCSILTVSSVRVVSSRWLADRAASLISASCAVLTSISLSSACFCSCMVLNVALSCVASSPCSRADVSFCASSAWAWWAETSRLRAASSSPDCVANSLLSVSFFDCISFRSCSTLANEFSIFDSCSRLSAAAASCSFSTVRARRSSSSVFLASCCLARSTETILDCSFRTLASDNASLAFTCSNSSFRCAVRLAPLHINARAHERTRAHTRTHAIFQPSHLEIIEGQLQATHALPRSEAVRTPSCRTNMPTHSKVTVSG